MNALILSLLLSADVEQAPPPPPRNTQTFMASTRSDTIFTCIAGTRPHAVWLSLFKGHDEASLKTLVVMCDPDTTPIKETKP